MFVLNNLFTIGFTLLGKAAIVTRSKINRPAVRTTTEISVGSNPTKIIISSDKRQQGQKYKFNKIVDQNLHSSINYLKPAVTDYDYYDDEEKRFVGGKSDDKLLINKDGIQCLDQGNFAHPDSCKRFITCAKMFDNRLVGTEYTCPPKLSFDPIGGICNWSAGIGCNE